MAPVLSLSLNTHSDGHTPQEGLFSLSGRENLECKVKEWEEVSEKEISGYTQIRQKDKGARTE